MNRFFSTATFVIPILFAPLTVLILLSQNTVPGNFLYPYKRGLEVIILAAAKLNPTTEAYFHTSLSDRRYAEAENLLLAKNDISGLSSFVDEVNVTQLAIAQISDQQKQQELNAALIAKIDSYQTGLTKIQVQTAAVTAQEVQQQIVASPTPFVTLVISTPTVQEVQKNSTQPTKEPGQQIPTATLVVRQPTAVAQQPTIAPSVQTVSNTSVVVAISQTQDRLKKIKEKARQDGERDDKKEKEKEKQSEDQKEEEKHPEDSKQTSKDNDDSKKSRVDKN